MAVPGVFPVLSLEAADLASASAAATGSSVRCLSSVRHGDVGNLLFRSGSASLSACRRARLVLAAAAARDDLRALAITS